MSAARSRRANDKHNHLQRTPILVMGCSLLIACCIAFGGTNWTASAQPSEDQLPEQNAIVEPGYYQETIGSYEAISQSDDDERAENLRLAAEAINGYVIDLVPPSHSTKWSATPRLNAAIKKHRFSTAVA